MSYLRKLAPALRRALRRSWRHFVSAMRVSIVITGSILGMGAPPPPPPPVPPLEMRDDDGGGDD